jgi:DNA-binding YbaB/EbfC family protein
MNLGMINQARQLKAKLDETQKELGKLEIVADAGKGAVKVTVNGHQKIVALEVSPDVIDPTKPQQLEQLLLKAIREGQAKAEKEAGKRMKGLTGGLKIPGLF